MCRPGGRGARGARAPPLPPSPHRCSAPPPSHTLTTPLTPPDLANTAGSRLVSRPTTASSGRAAAMATSCSARIAAHALQSSGVARARAPKSSRLSASWVPFLGVPSVNLHVLLLPVPQRPDGTHPLALPDAPDARSPRSSDPSQSMTLSLRTELIQFNSVPYVHTHSVISIAILRALTCDANYMPKHLAEPWQSPGRALLEPCQHPVRTLSEPSGEVPKAGFAPHYVGLCSSSIRKWREPNRGHRWVLSRVRQFGYLNKNTVQFTVRMTVQLRAGGLSKASQQAVHSSLRDSP